MVVYLKVKSFGHKRKKDQSPEYILTILGWDEGGFSAVVTLTSFQRDNDILSDNWKNDPTGLANRTANITSFGVLGAAIGAMLSLTLVDRFGRLRCWQLFTITWALGLMMQVFSSGIYALLLFSRIGNGVGAGGLTVAAPLYLSEIAPAKTRGQIVSIYMVFVLTFLTLGSSVQVTCTIPV